MRMRLSKVTGAIAGIMVLALVMLLAACSNGGDTRTTDAGATENAPAEASVEQRDSYSRPSTEELREILTPEQFAVVCNDGTEPAFKNAFWDHKEPGIYVDVVSGEPLFSSLDKFDSGTGWPSFTKPIEAPNIVEKRDTSHGMIRTEVRSKHGDSHLGHLFSDGPRDRGGMRYCINSASLRFVPVDKLESEGYGRFLPLFEEKTTVATHETIDLAGGCFWGMEEILRGIPGVISTEVGYTGGDVKNATYRNHEGHAEAVRVVYDPAVLKFDTLLRWFFRMHDATTLNRQGNDIGTSYRSEIFWHTEAQRDASLAMIKRIDSAGKYGGKIVTKVSKASDWWVGEEYHQDYLQKNPGGYTCHWLRPESVLGE